MGLGSPGGGGGAGAGNARGTIEMDISQLIAAANHAKQLGVAFERALNGVNAPTQRAQTSIRSLSSQLLALGGVASGLALAQQFSQFALAADATATSYQRQSVAALSLAGSQSKLNELLATYDRVTGGAIDKATALSDVTKLQAVGFADDAAELEKFAVAARGISVAMGSSQEYIIGQLQLSIANQSVQRLDQLGVGVEEVQERIKDLKAADSTLSKEMAYQNALLGIATEKYGALAGSLEAQKTGAEGAAKAWKELALSFGNLMGPTVDTIGNQFAAFFDAIADGFDRSSQAAQDFGKWLQWVGQQTLSAQTRQQGREFMSSLGYSLAPTAPRTIGGPSRGERNRPVSGGGTGYDEDQTKLIQQWSTDVQSIEREAGRARVDATRSFEQQRSEAVSEFGRQVVREEQDFARSRLRALQDYAKSVADAQADAAESEADALKDYAKSIDDLNEDAGKRDARSQRDYAERIAELRADGNERLQELEENYQRDQERSAVDHRDRLMGAAARLDAVGVFEEQKAYARQQADAKDSYEEQRKKVGESLDEQLADAKEAQEERLADAKENDADRLADMQEAFDEQRAEARKDSDRRLEDMQADFDARIVREDEDRALANTRRDEDQAAQMAQMAAAQAERMAALDLQEIEEKKQLESKFLAELNAAGLYNENWAKIQKAGQENSLRAFSAFWDAIEQRFMAQGPKTQAEAGAAPTGFPIDFLGGRATARTSFSGGSSGRSVTVGDIVIYAAPGQSETAIGAEVRRQLALILEEAG